MRTDALGRLGDAAAVVRAVAAGARRHGVPPPAALAGEWFGASAVVAPSVDVSPVAPEHAFDVAPGALDTGEAGVFGGWIGWRGYPDVPAGRPDAGIRRLPEAAGGWTDRVLRRDAAGWWFHESLDGSPCPRWLTEALARRGDARPWRLDWTAPDRAAHGAGVRACLAAIAAGEIYQACVCTRFTGELTGDPLDVFADALTALSPARAAYLAGPFGSVASLSPELFCRRHGTATASSPIKGTLPAHAPPAALRASVKDVAENVMIVDLVRNDLGRVAVTGSVDVAELLAVRPAPGVWHLVSTVTAQVPTTVGSPELVEALFPPASVTGTPKLRARELLSAWEPAARGVYCGAVGMASPVAGLELNVAIRTLEVDAHGGATLGVGGGITADSDADAEWQECLDKAAAIVGLRSRAPGRQPRRETTAS